MPDVRPARVGDAPAIAQVIAEAFGDAARLMPMGCRGAHRWIADAIARPADGRRFTVAVDGDAVVGAADVLHAERQVFLSYIATAPQERGRGTGAAVLHAAFTTVPHDAATILALDVFADNARARDWYDRLGLAPVAMRVWYELPLPPSHAAPAPVSDRAASDAAHAERGFSNVGVGRHTVGRLGDDWYRLADLEVLDDPAAIAALRQLDARRRAFAILPEGTPVPAGARELRRSVRMQGSLAAAVAALAAGVRA